MELELGLKFTRVADEFTSDFQIAQDRAGILFLSRETDTMFVLTAHLKGYKRSKIKIDINEDGSLIGVSGEKHVKETMMVGWKLYKKDVEIKGFKKVFKIPDGVILDKIKAMFNEDESSLTITMPKKVKGIRGTSIEEVKEEHQLVKEGSGNLQIADEHSTNKGKSLKTKVEDRVDDLKDEEGPSKEDVENRRKVEEIEERIESKEDKGVDKGNEGVENRRNVEEIEERIENKEDQEVDKGNDVLANEDVENRRNLEEIEERIETKEDKEFDKGNDVLANENVEEIKEKIEAKVEKEIDKKNDVIENEERLEEGKEGQCEKVEEKGFKMCLPCVAGSTLLLSFVVFVIQIIRSKNRNRNSTGRD